MNIPQEIERLAKLRSEGLMSEEEFVRAKTKLLDELDSNPIPPESSSSYVKPVTIPGTASLDVNQWSMFIHISQFVPGIGFVIPIILWQIKKNESPIIDQHGKNVVNWMISAFIYAIVSMILCVILIGFVMLVALGICGIIFAILGAIRAYEGRVWEYPMTIRFFK